MYEKRISCFSVSIFDIYIEFFGLKISSLNKDAPLAMNVSTILKLETI